MNPASSGGFRAELGLPAGPESNQTQLSARPHTTLHRPGPAQTSTATTRLPPLPPFYQHLGGASVLIPPSRLF